ncbi:50S ribosomal protein L29 [Mycoplasmopsis gallinacea]|uniref:Large ribosomal subunit protein uL29 n=1 Tax=Mycoplasmopsis gallinacea TaxID=29556 RepID=A0A0D5ZK44_9BACT|nr:50S ribosomal protein L29 [Mycoplasmopsis gallinacea]AKA50097.1 50S ribosomal protein L29 [Mycoplasmopsis gallinacea]QIW62151.1 50S ribosomal protein L29 [Mycoplasmopsis gallinacea]VEU58797.1 50S ribosomal protein L29 [Mycoplasmopsis gallinacea]
MLYKDIKAKSREELLKLVNDLKAELWTLRFKNSTGSLDQTHKISSIRKDIAKVLTALNEKGAK